MIVALLIVHGLLAVALLGALTHQAFSVGIRQRVEQHGVHYAENSAISANAQRQRRDRQRGEAGGFQ